MKIDFLIQGWERYDVPDELAEEIVAKIESGEIRNGGDIMEQYQDCASNEGFILDTMHEITVEQNAGDPTIEIERGGNTVYQNGDNE